MAILRLIIVLFLAFGLFFKPSELKAVTCDQDHANYMSSNPGSCTTVNIQGSGDLCTDVAGFTYYCCPPGQFPNLSTNICELVNLPNEGGGTTSAGADTPCGEMGEAGLNLGDCLKLKDGSTVSSVYNQPTVLINLLVRNIFVVAGIILFLSVIFAGFKLISGSTKGLEESKTLATSALMGLALMFAAFWIIQILEVVLGTDLGI